MSVTYGTHAVLQVSDSSSVENVKVNHIKSHIKRVIFKGGKFHVRGCQKEEVFFTKS